MSRKKIFLWSAAGLIGLVLITFAAGVLILRSHGFHVYALHKIIARMEEATGGRVEIQSYDFDWATLRAKLYNVALHGTEQDAATPLFAADSVTVGFKVISF